MYKMNYYLSEKMCQTPQTHSNIIFNFHFSVFEPEGPMWVKMVDPESNVRELDEENAEIEKEASVDNNDEGDVSDPGADPNEDEVVLQDGQRIIVSHPRRKNHRINMKKSPPMTPSKASTENSSCLVERRL